MRSSLNAIDYPLLAGPSSAGYEYFSTSLPIPTVLQLLAAFLPQDLGTCRVHSLRGPIHPCFPLILKQLLSHPTPFACFHIALLYITPCERSLCIPLVLFVWLPALLEREESLVKTYPNLEHTHSTFWSSAWHQTIPLQYLFNERPGLPTALGCQRPAPISHTRQIKPREPGHSLERLEQVSSSSPQVTCVSPPSCS